MSKQKRQVSEAMQTQINVLYSNIRNANEDAEVIGAVSAFMVYVCHKAGANAHEFLDVGEAQLQAALTNRAMS